MRAVNHTVTGALIGAVVVNPYVALPLALVSHLVLDAIPHYGGEDASSKKFLYGLFLDAGLAASFLLAIILLNLANWQIIIACGVLAASPDLLWFPHWVQELQGKKPKRNSLSRFLAWIQWSETSQGVIVEFAWLIGMVALFLKVTSV